MKPKQTGEKELWEIRLETGEEPEDMSPEEQLEFFRRDADESLGSLVNQRKPRSQRFKLLEE